MTLIYQFMETVIDEGFHQTKPLIDTSVKATTPRACPALLEHALPS